MVKEAPIFRSWSAFCAALFRRLDLLLCRLPLARIRYGSFTKGRKRRALRHGRLARRNPCHCDVIEASYGSNFVRVKVFPACAVPDAAAREGLRRPPD
jgi:hypothetical protein